MHENLFERLRIYGVQKIENAVLAGLLNGDPVLLIGTHGSAKTLLCRRLAEAMGLCFMGYDASKAMFEDIIGFPNPRSLSEGKVDYAPTPISIWGKQFVLIDEISRASPSMQNKWLEVIRSKQIMGKKVEGLRFIFAAMNQPGYLGAIPLDHALAGRFAFHITMPEAKDMSPRDVNLIMNEISEDDAPEWKERIEKLAETDMAALLSFLDSARTFFGPVRKKYERAVQQYVAAISASFKLQKKYLDGRRIGMMSRNLQGLLTVYAQKKGAAEFTLDELNEIFLEGLRFSLPFECAGEKMSPDLVTLAHSTAFKFFGEHSERLNTRLEVFLAPGILAMSHAFIENADKLGPEDHEELLTHIEEFAVVSKDESGIMVDVAVGISHIINAIQSGKIKVIPDVAERALGLWQKITSGGRERRSVEMAMMLEEMLNPSDADYREPIQGERVFSMKNETDWLAFRIAYGIFVREDQRAKKRGIGIRFPHQRRPGAAKLDADQRDYIVKLYTIVRNRIHTFQKENERGRKEI